MTVAMAICGLIIGGLSFLTNRSLTILANAFKNDSFWDSVPMVSTSPQDSDTLSLRS